MKKKSSDSKMISFRLNETDLKHLDKMAEESGESRSQFIIKKCFSNTDSNENIGILLNHLEKMGSYLINLKKGNIEKETFLEIADKELEYLWHTLN